MPENKTFDFTNTDALDQALALAETAVAGTPKAKKEPKPRMIDVTFTADRIIDEGETITFKFEVPKSTGTRGMVAGIPLEEMTDDQLKIEHRNANSVAYKTHKAGRDASKADARLAAVKAELEKRGIQPGARAAGAKVDLKAIAAMIKNGTLDIEALNALLDAPEEVEVEEEVQE